MALNELALTDLISRFESGTSISSELKLINEADPEELFSWLCDHDAWWPFDDYIMAVDEEDVFRSEERDILEFYERDYLLSLNDAGILDFVQERLNDCMSYGDAPGFHFYQITPNTLLSARAELHGQAGWYPYSFNLFKNPQELVQWIIEWGYIFESDDEFSYPDELAIEKYRQFVLSQVDG